jgi:hypothetical protein
MLTLRRSVIGVLLVGAEEESFPLRQRPPYDFSEENKTALEAWDRHLDALLTGHTAARVVPFRQ